MTKVSMSVFSGRNVNPFEMTVDEIDIEDIATSLSHVSRFNGHTKFRYSVAQHLVLCAEVALAANHDIRTVRAVFGHDKPEAYTGDVVRPLLRIPEIQAVHKRMTDHLICLMGTKWDFPVDSWFVDDVVKEIDNRMLMTEKATLQPASVWEGVYPEPYTDVVIEKWSTAKCFRRFMEMHEKLQSKDFSMRRTSSRPAPAV